MGPAAVYTHDEDVWTSVADDNLEQCPHWLRHEHDNTVVPLGHAAVFTPLQNLDVFLHPVPSLSPSEPTVTSIEYFILEHVATAVTGLPLETAVQLLPEIFTLFRML